MARRRSPMSEGKKNIIADLMQKYDISSSYSFEVNGVTLTDMVKSSYRAIGGDSGGPVCIPGTNQYNYLLAGTQCASSLNNKGKWVDNSFSIFCKINNILSELECTSNP